MEPTTYTIPVITQEQKDANLVYNTIMQQQDTNLFTAHKFYQWFIKRDEFLARRNNGFDTFLDKRWTPEYIYCRLVDLHQLGYCGLKTSYYRVGEHHESLFELNPHLKGVSKYTNLGFLDVITNDAGEIEIKAGDWYGDKLESVVENKKAPVVVGAEGLTTIADIEKGLPVMSFTFNINAPVFGSLFSGVKKQSPVILALKNKSDKLQRVQLFKNQSIPDVIDISSGISGVSVQDIMDGIKFGKHWCEMIYLQVVERKEESPEPYEVYYAQIIESTMNGTISTAPLSMRDDAQSQRNLFLCQKPFPLNYESTLDLDIKPNDHIQLSLYLSKANEEQNRPMQIVKPG